MMDERNFANNKYYKCTYDEYVLSHCSSCARYKCPHRNTYGRYPASMGGHELCPNLQKFREEMKKRDKMQSHYDQPEIC